ncbi:MAG TPA: OpgC domain-containing protein [Stellaceae bacterium]|nr:OpgC domain-containing protein [Stellaceae bacterium]
MAGPVPEGGRDVRLDFFRGLSLIFIFIDHIPENFLSYFTVRSIAFNDAAEIFIFISGYTAALVYGRSLRQSGALLATAQIYRRVWQLYVAHIFLFVIFTAEVSYTLIAIQSPMYAEELGVGDFLQAPHIAIIRALLLDFQPPFLDILPLYIVLLGCFPPVLLALEKYPLVPVCVSAALYALTLARGWALHTYPADHTWFFNPLAWQFLFVIGASLGYAAVDEHHVSRVPTWLSRLAAVIAAGVAVISLSWTLHWVFDPFPPLLAKQLWNHTIDKTNLTPLRLISFLALAASVVHFVKRDNAFLEWRATRAIVVCGKHSLYVFCLGILLSVLGHFILTEFYGGIGTEIAVNLAGIALMIGAAALFEWFKAASRRPRHAAGPVPATPSE